MATKTHAEHTEEDAPDRVQEIAQNTSDLVEDVGDVLRATIDATAELTSSWIVVLGDSLSNLTRRRDTPRRRRSEAARGVGAATVDVVRDVLDVVQDTVEASADAVRRSSDRFREEMDRDDRPKRRTKTTTTKSSTTSDT